MTQKKLQSLHKDRVVQGIETEIRALAEICERLDNRAPGHGVSDIQKATALAISRLVAHFADLAIYDADAARIAKEECGED